MKTYNFKIIAFVFCATFLFKSSSAHARAYTASATGNWNNSATWQGVGVPGSGDTFTIPSPFTVTVTDSETAGTGSSGSCTVAGAVNSGATLTVSAGGTLTVKGELDLQHGANLNVNSAGPQGQLTLKPGSGATCKLNFLNAGTGVTNFNLSGHSTSYANLFCDQSAGGFCYLQPPGGGTMPTLTFNFATVKNFGTNSQRAFNGFNASSVNLQNTLFDNNGDVSLSIGTCATCNFIAEGLTFTNPQDLTGSGNHETVFEFYASSNPTSGQRSFQNIVASTRSQNTLYHAFMSVNHGRIGQSVAGGDGADVPGFIGYNVNLLESGSGSSAASEIIRNTGVIMDIATGGTNCYSTVANSEMTMQDFFCLSRVPNQHEIIGGSPTNVGPNLYQRYVCDGDGFFNSDTGDEVQDWGTYTLKNAIGINRCGTLVTISNNSTEVATVINNTNYNNFGGTLCETGCHDGIMPVIRDNLIVAPNDVNHTGIRGDDGFHGATAYIRQTNFSLDYNAFYDMPGSADPGAESQPNVPPLFPNLALGGTISYLNLNGQVVGGLANKSVTSGDPTHIYCSGCNFLQGGANSVQPGDYVLDNISKTYATVSTVTDSNRLVLTSPGISGLTTGQTFNVQMSYWDTPGATYGVTPGLGTHDIHANPLFIDKTRTLCTWYVANGGQVACPTYGSTMAGTARLLATSGTGGTTLTCSNCNFTANGVTSADILQIYAGTGSTVRGWAQVVSVSSTSLTLATSIAGMTSGDSFDFITSTQGIGRQMVTLNGFDWQGHAVTPVTWATPMNALSYITRGFTPQNRILRHAGSPADGSPDIGAVPFPF